MLGTKLMPKVNRPMGEIGLNTSKLDVGGRLELISLRATEKLKLMAFEYSRPNC